jgi:hypothetical protein
VKLRYVGIDEVGDVEGEEVVVRSVVVDWVDVLLRVDD